MEAKQHNFQQPTIKVKMSRAIRLSLLLTFLLAAGTLAAQTTASSIRSFTDQLGDEAIIRMAGDDYSVTYNHRISGSMHYHQFLVRNMNTNATRAFDVAFQTVTNGAVLIDQVTDMHVVSSGGDYICYFCGSARQETGEIIDPDDHHITQMDTLGFLASFRLSDVTATSGLHYGSLMLFRGTSILNAFDIEYGTTSHFYAVGTTHDASHASCIASIQNNANGWEYYIHKSEDTTEIFTDVQTLSHGPIFVSCKRNVIDSIYFRCAKPNFPFDYEIDTRHGFCLLSMCEINNPAFHFTRLTSKAPKLSPIDNFNFVLRYPIDNTKGLMLAKMHWSGTSVGMTEAQFMHGYYTDCRRSDVTFMGSDKCMVIYDDGNSFLTSMQWGVTNDYISTCLRDVDIAMRSLAQRLGLPVVAGHYISSNTLLHLTHLPQAFVSSDYSCFDKSHINFYPVTTEYEHTSIVPMVPPSNLEIQGHSNIIIINSSNKNSHVDCKKTFTNGDRLDF